MTFDEADTACRKVADLGAEVMSSCASADAQAMERLCRQFASQMTGRFGNVAEQMSRVATAAKAFQKSRFVVSVAQSELSMALARVRGAIDMHRRSDRSRWGE